MRYVIIADIHGCLDEMQLLLQEARFDREKDTLILAGDLMDRGPKNVECFLFIRDLKEELGERFVYVRGNHDQMLMDAEGPGFRIRSSKRELWYFNGGDLTAEAFRKAEIPVREAAVWLQENTVLYYEGEGFQVVHADLVNDCALSEVPAFTLIWGRTIADRNQYHGPFTILGHTPMRDLFYFQGDGKMVVKVREKKVFHLPETGALIIDTGGVYGGKFSAAAVEDGFLELFSVPGRNPEEKEEL